MENPIVQQLRSEYLENLRALYRESTRPETRALADLPDEELLAAEAARTQDTRAQMEAEAARYRARIEAGGTWQGPTPLLIDDDEYVV